MSRLKVAIVGTGVGRGHAEGYAALPDRYEIAAVCGLDPAANADLAKVHGIPLITEHYQDILEADLDLIDICTPSSLHFDQACAGLRAGKHVLIEKPAARSLAEIDALIALEAETGRRACPVFQYRFGHGIQKLHHLIAKGVAGRPSIASAETHWIRGTDYYNAAAWRGTWDGETGGTFTTHAIHIHDLLSEVLGPIASVHARMSRRVNGNETEDMGLLSLTFESGAMASASVTLGAQDQMSRLRFCFDDLTAESARAPYNPGHDPWTFTHADPAVLEAALADFTPQDERFVGQFARLHPALTEGGPLPVTLADSRRSIELLTAAYWSAHSGETQSLPVPTDHPFYAGWLDTMKRVPLPD